MKIFTKTLLSGFGMEIAFAACLSVFGISTISLFAGGCAEKNVRIKARKVLSSDLSSSNSLDEAALAVLKSDCFSCHGKDGSNAGNMGNILNIPMLKEKKLLKFGDLGASPLYQRMLDKKQPMPPSGILAEAKLNVIRDWIMSDSIYNRVPIPFENIYNLISDDFKKQNDKVNIRYFHLVNQYNSGVPEANLNATRAGLSKTLNMLSTSEKIISLNPIDEKKLVFRVNLMDYDIHRPETLYTYMLQKIYPSMRQEEKEKWLPAPEDRIVSNFYGGRFKEIFEGKSTLSKFIQPEKHTFTEGLPFANHPLLADMVRQMRESGQKLDDLGSPSGYAMVSAKEAAQTKACQLPNSTSKDCSSPIPLLRADWFVSQVAANMQMRLYYHAAGMDDDTITLDVALGIDDVEGFLTDTVAQPNSSRLFAEKFIRAGFNNSGVSVNHRAIERVPLSYTPGKPLWRAYEFKDKLKNAAADIFENPAGPFFEISVGGDPGYECITLMTPLYTTVSGRSVRTMHLMDLGLFYPSQMYGGEDPAIVKALKSSRSDDPGRRDLLAQFKEIYKHEDFTNYRAADYRLKHGALPKIQTEEFGEIEMMECEAPTHPTFRHDSLEYFFVKRNGMPAFVNVGLSAEHLDYKIPNQRALEANSAILIPAFDKPEMMVVGAPLSCLSCHAKGFIEKKDMVNDYVSKGNFSDEVKQKVRQLHGTFDELRAQMDRDNQLIHTAISEAGVALDDPEPIVETYRNWAIPGLGLLQVAHELEITEENLKDLIKNNSKVGKILRELTIEGSVLKRSDFERVYYELMCHIHKSCKNVPLSNIIPAQ